MLNRLGHTMTNAKTILPRQTVLFVGTRRAHLIALAHTHPITLRFVCTTHFLVFVRHGILRTILKYIQHDLNAHIHIQCRMWLLSVVFESVKTPFFYMSFALCDHMHMRPTLFKYIRCNERTQLVIIYSHFVKHQETEFVMFFFDAVAFLLCMPITLFLFKCKQTIYDFG